MSLGTSKNIKISDTKNENHGLVAKAVKEEQQ